MSEIEALAKHLWDTGQHRPHAPAWEQLGDVTKSVWLERAAAQLYGDIA